MIESTLIVTSAISFILALILASVYFIIKEKWGQGIIFFFAISLLFTLIIKAIQ